MDNIFNFLRDTEYNFWKKILQTFRNSTDTELAITCNFEESSDNTFNEERHKPSVNKSLKDG